MQTKAYWKRSEIANLRQLLRIYSNSSRPEFRNHEIGHTAGATWIFIKIRS